MGRRFWLILLYNVVLADCLLENYTLPSYDIYCNKSNNNNNNIDIDKCKYSYEQYNDDLLLNRSLLWLEDTIIKHKNDNDNDNIDVNLYRIKKLLYKIYNGDNVNILCAGGSLTEGVRSTFPYSVYLENKLNDYYINRGYINSKVRVDNRGVGGTDTLWAFHHLSTLLEHESDEPIDLVILDYDVNDCAHMINDDILQQRDLIAQTESLLRQVIEKNVNTAVLYLNIAVAGTSMLPDCNYYHTCYAMGELKRPVFDAYSVPIISQKLALWYNFSCPPTPTYWPCGGYCSHPTSAGHVVLSNLLFGFLTSLSFKNNTIISKYYDILSVKEDSVPHMNRNFMNYSIPEIDLHLYYPEHPLYPLTEKLNSEACINNFLTSIGEKKKRTSRHYGTSSKNESELFTHNNYTMSSPNEDRIAYRHPCWIYREDRIRKPGWIVEDDNCDGSPIIFNVSFGSSPLLTITFLSTYDERFANVHVHLTPNRLYSTEQLNSSTNQIHWDFIGEINGYHGNEPKVSVSYDELYISHYDAAHMHDKHHHTYILQSIMKPNTDYLLRISFILPKDRSSSSYTRKFKLISIVSC